MFVVYGSNLGTTSTGPLSFPLPTQMNGTSIKVVAGSGSVDAIMIYTTPGQIAGILPSNTPTGSAILTVTANGQQSLPVNVTVVPSSFGAFTLNQAGSGPGVIQNYISNTSQPVNTITTPATAGQTVILWGTGLGAITTPDAGPPSTSPVNMQSTLNVKVWVGTQLASVAYAGRSGCCSGIDQVVFSVPQGVQGCYLPVAVEAGGVVSNFTSMAVEPSAGAGCSDPDGIDSADIKLAASSGSARLGVVDLTHISLALVAGSKATPIVSDTAYGVFGTYSTAQLQDSLGITQSPSIGGCTVSQFQGLNPLPVDPIKPSAQDAGSSLSISGPNGTQKISGAAAGIYAATVGGVPLDQILTAKATPAYFQAGSYTVTGTGGSSVGSFSAQIAVPTEVTWTNESSITAIDRTKDLNITWSGGSPGQFVTISGTASVTSGGLGPSATSPGNAFLCIANAADGSFTVPSWVLQTLPNTKGQIAASFLLVGTQTPVSKFSASGLDDGYVVYRSLNGVGLPFE